MKKLVLALVLTVALSVNAFAEHPDGWGVGVVGRGGWSGQSGGWGSRGLGGLAISLKAPMFPIYWGLSFDLGTNFFGMGITGDYHLIHNNIYDFDGPKIGWYLGVGGFLGFSHYSPSRSSWTSLRFGGRVPVGLSFQVPAGDISFEVFGALVPHLGLGFWFRNSEHWPDTSRAGIIGGIGGELGIRFWF